MRFFVKVAVLAVTGWIPASAQFTVPFSEAGRPRQLKAEIVNGSLEVTGYDGQDAIIEQASSDKKAKGLRRIDAGNSFTLVENDNVININGGVQRAAHLRIKVPFATSLQLRCVNCDEVVVERITGDVDVDTVNGGIRIVNASGSIVAHALNEKVVASLDQVGSKLMSFSSMNGSLDITLPDDLKANVRLRTEHGKVMTDFELRLQGTVRTDRGLFGTIGGGGPELTLRTFNGNVYLRKKKPAR